jgi:hypothetical protein
MSEAQITPTMESVELTGVLGVAARNDEPPDAQ